MKRINLKILIVVLLVLAVTAYAAWQDRTLFTGDLEDSDTFMFNDTSDTTDHAAGTVKRRDWGRIRSQLRRDRPVCMARYAPSSSDDFLLIKNTTGETITILNIYGVLQSGTNVIGGLDECDSNGASCAAIDSDITFDGSEDTDDGSLSNATVDNNDWIRWHTTSSSAPGWFTVCFKFE